MKTTTTEAKMEAIQAASNLQPWNMPKLLAMLTSAIKDERDQAKRLVREMIRVGQGALLQKQAAADLASFANRHEP